MTPNAPPFQVLLLSVDINNMAANEVNVAIAALAVAVVAFLIALGQLLQQLLGTADGYRRCRSSVIGGWSKLVRRRLKW